MGELFNMLACKHMQSDKIRNAKRRILGTSSCVASSKFPSFAHFDEMYLRQGLCIEIEIGLGALDQTAGIDFLA